MIRGGGGKSSGYSADLMVCFPSRTHLSLPCKQICSPSSSHSFSRRQNAPHHRRSLSKLSGSSGVHQNRGVEEIAEPTSPKVTCAGQIKVRPSKRDGGTRTKNWQSLMAEIEKIHKSKSESKFFGIKKDVMGFLTCLRDLRFDFRCFGAFPPVDAISDDDDEEEEEEEDEDEDESSGTVFSKWFMVLHEKQNNEECVDDKEQTCLDAETAVPPPNALLLMRCRSAPVKNWLEVEEKKKTETEEDDHREYDCENTEKQSEEEKEKETVRKKKDLRSLMEEENTKNLMVMSYDTNYYKLSSDIANETWVVGGIQDHLFRSRSWKK